MIGCHTDLLAGAQARRSIVESWQWLETD